MIQHCKDGLTFLGLTEHIPLTLKVKSKSGSIETLILDDQNIDREETEQEKSQAVQINMLLYAKERFNMNNEAYHELSMILNKCMPRSYLIKRKIQDMNSSFNIKPIGSNIEGFEQSIKELLPQVIEQLQHTNATVPEIIKVKLSGDGTWLGSKLHVINFTFTLPDFPNAKASSGNTLLAIFKAPESYKNLKKALYNIAIDCENFTHVTVNDKIYPLLFYLGGDLKFLNLMCGIDSNSSKYSCLWCTCSSGQRYDMTKDWSIIDTKKGARTIEMITKCAILKNKEKKYKCSHPPIFNFIPLTRVIPDRLNLFLRISDQLINQLIKDLKTQDNITKLTVLPGNKKHSYKHIQGFENYLKEIGISWNLYVDKDSKMLKGRSFTGPEKLKIIKNINMCDLLPDIDREKREEMQSLWEKFTDLMSELDELCDNASKIEMFNSHAKEWVRCFTSIYPTKDVTPYMHILVYHVSEIIQMHGSLSQYTEQGLERLNDNVSKWYFRSTGFSQNLALKQILQKQNRMRKLQMDGGSRKPKFQWGCRKFTS